MSIHKHGFHNLKYSLRHVNTIKRIYNNIFKRTHASTVGHYACGVNATEHMCYDLFRIVGSCLFVTTCYNVTSSCERMLSVLYYVYIVLFEYNLRIIHYYYFFKEIYT